MFLSKINFGAVPTDLDAEAVEDAINGYIAALQINGQMVGDCLCSICEGHWVAFANLTRRDATQVQHYSESGLEHVAAIREAFGTDPVWKVIEDDREIPMVDYQNSPFLYMFSFAYEGGSPIRCGETAEPIPTYLLPVDDEQTREGLFNWSREYNLYDSLWIGSGVLEIASYDQIASPDSMLGGFGRDLAARVEQATGKPTYYFLLRYFGRDEAEKDRKCPGCGGEWLVEENLGDGIAFHEFAFRCDDCRLVSNMADAADDDSYAEIGEFEPKTEQAGQ